MSKRFQDVSEIDKCGFCRMSIDSFRSSFKFIIAVTSHLFVFILIIGLQNSYGDNRFHRHARARSPLSQWSLPDVLPCCDPRYDAG